MRSRRTFRLLRLPLFLHSETLQGSVQSCQTCRGWSRSPGCLRADQDLRKLLPGKLDLSDQGQRRSIPKAPVKALHVEAGGSGRALDWRSSAPRVHGHFGPGHRIRFCMQVQVCDALQRKGGPGPARAGPPSSLASSLLYTMTLCTLRRGSSPAPRAFSSPEAQRSLSISKSPFPSWEDMLSG